MSLILDHINGEATDNRLENLRIVCPNCAATLDTHCGKALRRPRTARACHGCGVLFVAESHAQRYCSHACFARAQAGVPQPHRRVVDRPPLAQLLAEIEASSWSAVGRRYGVSDNAVRKWVRQYERQRSPPDAPQAEGSAAQMIANSSAQARKNTSAGRATPTARINAPSVRTSRAVEAGIARPRTWSSTAARSRRRKRSRRTPVRARSASSASPPMPTTRAEACPRWIGARSRAASVSSSSPNRAPRVPRLGSSRGVRRLAHDA
jgi:transposase-like protein